MSTHLVGVPSVDDSDRADAGTARPRAIRWGPAALSGLVVAVGVAARVHSPSALWLDEAISVDISSLPLGEVPEALRRDGAPPLYALILWGWERLVGDGPTAVRLLSALFGIAALPVAAVAGARLAGRAGGIAALLLFATSPFAVYYSSEARMYSLVVLLTLGGFVALDNYLRYPGAARGVVVAVLTAALALTHYWSLFLIVVVTGCLLTRARQARSRRDAGAVAWMAAGGVLFLPWLPTFLFQFSHTGTPWGLPAGFAAALSTVAEWSGGAFATSRLLAIVLILLAGVGATATVMSGWRLELDLRGRPPGRALAVVAGATLVLALAVGRATGAAFAPRYTSVVLPLFLLLAAVGVVRLSGRLRTAILAVAVVTGLAGAVPHAFNQYKTQAAVAAQALRSEALPGDVVVYCPDQLGPATSRLLPAALRQELYPTGGSPARVDWVDYEERNQRADPVAYARDLSTRAGRGAVWLVDSPGYRTYEGHCEALIQTLTELRGTPLVLVEADTAYFQSAEVRGWAPLAIAGPSP